MSQTIADFSFIMNMKEKVDIAVQNFMYTDVV